MSDRLTDLGRQTFLEGAIAFLTDTIKSGIVDFSAGSSTWIKPITAATNATPIVITATSHGFANGDTVVILNVGGNLSANQTGLVANQTTNTFELQTLEATNVVGSAAYTSGGFAVNISKLQFLSQISSMVVGTNQTLGTKVSTNGIAGCANIVYSTTPASGAAQALAVLKDTGSSATSTVFLWLDGRTRVLVAALASSGGTSIAVDPLLQTIASGTVIVFSNGASATLSAQANAGARTLAVSSLAANVTQGAAADVIYSGANLPLNLNGGQVTFTIPSTGNKLFKL